MSIQAMQWVLEQSRARLGTRLVLLVIAWHADRAGENAWPSLAGVARRAGLTKRQVQRCLGALVRSGELELVRGGGPGGTAAYRLKKMQPQNEHR